MPICSRAAAFTASTARNVFLFLRRGMGFSDAQYYTESCQPGTGN